MVDPGWEEYWKTYGQQHQEWTEQIKAEGVESLHMPAKHAVLPSIWKVEEKPKTWRDEKPML